MKNQVICRRCGNIFFKEEAQKAHTVSRGLDNSIYLCEHCRKAHKGNSIQAAENNVPERKVKANSRGIDTPIGYRFTCSEKVENGFLSMLDAKYNLYKVAQVAGKTTFQTINMASNSSGLQSMFETFNLWVDVAGNAPITVGIPEEKAQAIAKYEKAIFADLRTAGKDFWGGNGNIVNINSDNITFGASAWITPKHYLHTIQMCKDMVACLETWFFGKGANDEAAKKASKQLARVYNKYSERQAQCQKPAFNKYGLDY